MFYKRTLILNDINNLSSGKKGVITLENFSQGVKGQLKLYNFKEYPKNVAIGLSSGQDVIKVPLQIKDNTVDFVVKKDINLQEKISCGLVDIQEATNPKIVVGGTSNYLNDWADKVEQAFYDAQILSREEIYDSSDKEVQQEITTVLRQDREFEDCSKCEKCKYKKAFFEKENEVEKSNNVKNIEQILSTATMAENAENSDEKTSENQDKNIQEDKSFVDKDIDFYNQIKDQIDDLFSKHKPEDNLQAIIPNSKWVKVEYQDMPGYYVMGIIYNDNIPEFIGYGLPAQNNENPPKDLAEYAQWLPVLQEGENTGYWIVYQSASNGESIKVV